MSINPNNFISSPRIPLFGDQGAKPDSPPDPFDLDALRLPQNYVESITINGGTRNIAVRKPDKTWFFRVHPSSDYRFDTNVIELGGTYYLVANPLWNQLQSEEALTPMHLFTAINRDGELFIWPIRILDPNSYGASWSTSALEAAKQAETEWVRRTGIDKKQGVYIFGSAVAQHDEPAWPKMSFGDILETAFRDAFINSPDHPVLKKLRGEL